MSKPTGKVAFFISIKYVPGFLSMLKLARAQRRLSDEFKKELAEEMKRLEDYYQQEKKFAEQDGKEK